MNEEQEKQYEIIKDHLKIIRHGEIIAYLSPNWALKQNLNIEDLDKIVLLHNKLYDLFDEIELCEEKHLFSIYAKKVQEIEFELQDAWKFERDATKHIWWYQIPHCECNTIDNQELWGIDQIIVNKNCPIHGNLCNDSTAI